MKTDRYLFVELPAQIVLESLGRVNQVHRSSVRCHMVTDSNYINASMQSENELLRS